MNLDNIKLITVVWRSNVENSIIYHQKNLMMFFLSKKTKIFHLVYVFVFSDSG